eukprot:5545386-Pyramimonas_sp.AAC.3
MLHDLIISYVGVRVRYGWNASTLQLAHLNARFGRNRLAHPCKPQASVRTLTRTSADRAS